MSVLPCSDFQQCSPRAQSLFLNSSYMMNSFFTFQLDWTSEPYQSEFLVVSDNPSSARHQQERILVKDIGYPSESLVLFGTLQKLFAILENHVTRGGCCLGYLSCQKCVHVVAVTFMVSPYIDASIWLLSVSQCSCALLEVKFSGVIYHVLVTYLCRSTSTF